MLVEKLYVGMFVVDPENLLVFIAEQIAVVRALPDADSVSDLCNVSCNPLSLAGFGEKAASARGHSICPIQELE